MIVIFNHVCSAKTTLGINCQDFTSVTTEQAFVIYSVMADKMFCYPLIIFNIFSLIILSFAPSFLTGMLEI